jgi:hypothetical protein
MLKQMVGKSTEVKDELSNCLENQISELKNVIN